MSNMPKVNTVLVCKNSMLRAGLKHILSETRFSMDLEQPSYGEGGQADTRDKGVDLLIVDPNAQSANIADIVRSLKEQHARARVVVLAEHFDLENMLMMLRAGADGYCLATTGCEALVRYLDLVMLGEVVFPAANVLSAIASSQELREQTARISMESTESLPIMALPENKGSPVRTLSSREAEILQCLVQGSPNKVIARKLDVAEATVKVHIKAILRKIRVANRTQAAMWAVSHLSNSQQERSWGVLNEGMPLHYPSS